MGIGKFTLPLAFPLAFKYIVDVLLVREPKLEPVNALLDRWCTSLAHIFGFQATTHGKLAALSLVILAIYVIQAIASYFRNYWAGIAGHRLILDLRCALFTHLQRLSHSFFDRNPSGAIVARLVNDVEVAQNFVGAALTDVWMDGAALGFVVWILFVLDYRLAWISLGVIPFYICLIRRYAPRIKDTSRSLQEVMEEFSGELQERVAGAATVKSFGREEYESSNFNRQSVRLYDCTIEKVRLASAQQMYSELITRVAPMIVVWAAALMIMRNSMQIGTIVAFIGFLGYLYLPLQRFAELSIVCSSSLAAIERIFAFMDVKPDVSDHSLGRPLKLKRGTVEFEHVGFAYAARADRAPRTVLHDIAFRVGAGTTVALVGRSGAGKTTLASLLPRFYDATAGRVLIDGKDVRHFTLKSLRENIGFVTQETTLFSGTVRDIVCYGKPDASDGEIWNALEEANLKSTIAELPGQLDAIIGERGVKLSGGQRQRLAIARVFLKDPAILVLDEATSALDSKAENLVHEAMRRLMKGRTSFLIAHRLRSAIDADVIIALDRGRIVEMGSHDALLRRGGIYATLFHEQMRGLTLEPEPSLAASNGFAASSGRAGRRSRGSCHLAVNPTTTWPSDNHYRRKHAQESIF